MTVASDSTPSRLVPQLPPVDRPMRLLIDTDAANEIDDLYAIALAICSPERFALEGLVATHFAASAVGADGPASTGKSYDVIVELLEAADRTGHFRIARGGHPMGYRHWPSESEGADFIIERAHAGDGDDPLWVVVLGAATNTVSAICKDPTIVDKIRVVFHARCPEHWPGRSVQYNVKGDVNAARTLLETNAPLVWFDTGTNLCRSFEQTAETVAETGKLGRFLHEFRRRREHFMSPTKGFFDLADIAWMVDPTLCREEVVAAPTMDAHMFFDHEHVHGRMRRVYEIQNDPTWDLLCERLSRHESQGR